MSTGNTNANVIKGIQSKTVSLDMENGDQVVRPDSNKLLARVTVEKPATMVAGNIKNGVNIGGVVGSYTGLVPSGKKNITDMLETDVTNYASAQVVDANIVAGNIKSGVSILGVAGSMQAQKEEQTKTVTFSSDGQEVTPDTNKVLSKVTINKPSTLIAENVKKDVVIAGVTGTYDGGGGGDTKFPQPYHISRSLQGGGYSSSVRRGSNYYTTTTVTIDGTSYYSFGSVDGVSEVIVDGFSIPDKTLVCIGANKFCYNTSADNSYSQEKINNIYIYFQKNTSPTVQFVSEENVLYYYGYGDRFYPNKNVILKLSGTLTFTNVRVYESSGTYAYAWVTEETDFNNEVKVNYNEFISIPGFDSNSHYYYVCYLTKTGFNNKYSSLVTSDMSSYKTVTLSCTNCTCPYQTVLVNSISKLKIPVTPASGYQLPTSISASNITVTYDTDGYVLSNCSADTTVTITATAIPSSYTVTIHLSATAYDYSMSSNTLTVDGTDYYVNGSFGLSTDYPYNDQQITANVISITGGDFRWKDSNNSSWTVVTSDTKSWTLSSNNFEIWIDADDDE